MMGRSSWIVVRRESHLSQQATPESKQPAVLDYQASTPGTPAPPTLLERVTMALTIIGVVMFMLGSIMLDGGDMWIGVSIISGFSMALCGTLAIWEARHESRPVRAVGIVALVLGVAMILFAVASLGGLFDEGGAECQAISGRGLCILATL